MSRPAGLLVLAACVTLLLGAFLATASSIALGAWSPLGERPAPTQAPPDGPPIDGPEDPTTYDGFLEQVEAGEVQQVEFSGGERLEVSTFESGYGLELPAGVDDPYPDILDAASRGGVPPPFYTVDGAQQDLGERTYRQMLDDVAAGALFDVTQSGSQLSCSGSRGYYVVTLEDPAVDVLGDIEAAAAEGRVQPPSYSKYPGNGEAGSLP